MVLFSLWRPLGIQLQVSISFLPSVKILFHSFAEFKAGEGDVNNIIILTSKLMKFIKDH